MAVALTMPDLAYAMEWAYLLLRWVHVITVIAWIGASFYFVWLDNSLEKPQASDLLAKGVDGELWAVHGGGFYNPQKYLVAPKTLPGNLHWFYWESYSTWLSGVALFTVLYLANAKTYMIDPRLMAMSEPTAVGLALAFLICGWLAYELLCRLCAARVWAFAAALVALVGGASYGACHLFQGRAAFLIIGAMLATMMTANVFFWIIPGQRRVTAAMRAGKPVNPLDGKRGKQRSVHNTYLTLPVLFAMLSNHYSLMYSHAWNWLVLVLMMAASVLIRQFFLLRHKGQSNAFYPVAGIAIIIGVCLWLAPASSSGAAIGGREKVTTKVVAGILAERCQGCHSDHPSLMTGAPPKGVRLDTPADIESFANRIYIQTVQLRAMPLGNITHMTDVERATVARWYEQGQGMDR